MIFSDERWNQFKSSELLAVTRQAEMTDMSVVMEMEIIGAAGRQLEEAVDMIIQAAVEDLPFPEASYELVHNHCGGVDLLIGASHGKNIWQTIICNLSAASCLYLMIHIFMMHDSMM